jgi:hypothetical protein
MMSRILMPFVSVNRGFASSMLSVQELRIALDETVEASFTVVSDVRNVGEFHQEF